MINVSKKSLIINKSSIKSALLGLSVYLLMIDSGGAFGLRNIGFILIGMFALPYLIRKSVDIKVAMIILLSILVSFIGLYSNIINDVEISKAFQWIAFLIAIFIFYKSFLLFSEREFVNGFLLAGFLFSISVLLVHFLLITNLFIPQDELLTVLNLFFNGFFHRYSILGFDYFSIYFQSTLTLVVFTIIAYLNKSYKLYILFLFVIAISLSRFGFFVAVAIPILIYLIGVSKLSKLITIYIIPFSFTIIIFYFMIYFIYNDTFVADIYLSSSEARIAHTISIIESFNIYNFFMGQGLGSEFYTMRSGSLTDNTELSQLEFIRKFGFIAFLLFHLMIFLTMYFAHKKSFHKANLYIFTLYLASMSNPILTSLLFSILIGYSLSRILKIKSKAIYDKQPINNNC